MSGKLEGLLVVDFTAAVAGPFATQLMADSGARVIKIEAPSGDMLRTASPIGDTGPSLYFVGVNRGKESVCLDLKKSEDLEFAKTLIRRADVLVENFRPGVMDRFGLGYAAVKELNPKIVYASVSGFGHTGPNQHRACFDLVAQGYSGLMQTNAEESGQPSRVGFSMADVSSAMWAYMAIMTALFARERTGEGDHVDVAMIDGLFAMQIAPVVAYTELGEEPHRDGNRGGAAAPFGTIPTQDGHLVVAVVGAKLWSDFCAAIGMPELVADARFATPALRLRNRDIMRAVLRPLFATKTTTDWLDILERGGVPSGPINSIEQICKSEQICAREMLVTVGEVHVPGNPMKFSSVRHRQHYPTVAEIGQHTEAVKREFG
jgi:CoA:oxalate CoA-transferase